MEPLSALSLFCNIMDICDRAVKVCNTFRQIYKNVRGQRAQDEELLECLGEFQKILNGLRTAASKLSRDNLCDPILGPLNRLEGKSAAVKEILDGFRASKPGNAFASVMATAKVMRGQAVTKTTNHEPHRNTQYFLSVQIGEICSIADQLNEGQDEIRSGLTSLDARITKLDKDLSEVPSIVAEARGISKEVHTELCALSVIERLGNPNQRYWDVTEADSHTFRWIMRNEDEKSIRPHDSQSSLDNEDAEHEDAEHEDAENEHAENESRWEIEARLDYENTQRDVNVRLRNWLRNGKGLFHVSGKPGSGKSTLMKYLVQHPTTIRLLEEWAKPERLVLGRFFFWKPDQGENSLEALVRGLLRSMIHFDASLVHLAFPMCSKSSFEQLSLQSELQMTKSEVSKAFKNIVNDVNRPKTIKFCFFIDGLDELDEDKDTTHSEIVKIFQQWANTSTGFVKICVSSRHFPVFENMPVHDRIRIQDLTRYDIINFVRNALGSQQTFRSNMTANTKECRELVGAIVERADGVFLWVSLVVSPKPVILTPFFK
ncbi:hypothetical protein J7T55_010550 [Diaporthe amygdali]|uniref:uncharacterized protein n=1 Tax=Phomopsis amygdali TaxID=1214568 RepID=UPI0022FE70C7|nr:uncharacterized protein J7T55_010550 [Diaporthe amygdali]KAJ0115727.1 hypothetical protein J7T55_010550 [Diaporthe amygdali]